MQKILHTVLNELHGAARFRWPGIIAAWAVCLLGWSIVMLLPSKYESTARVFVNTATALSPVIQGIAIQQDVSPQLNLVEQSLLGEAQLDRVIDATDLAGRAKSEKDRAKLKDKLREDISVYLDAASNRGPAGSVYVLRYLDTDRARSLKIVEMLLKTFVDDTLGGKVKDSAAAQKFLASQIHDYETRLREAEGRLAAFKKENVGAMPGVEGDYFTRLQNEMDAAKKARSLLSVAMSRRDELAVQLKDGALLSTAGGGGAASTISLPGGRTATGGDTQTQLADAEARLNALLENYTDRHPDVVALRATIAHLKERRAEELAALRRGDQEAMISSGVTSSPLYQSMRLALNQADVEVAALRRELADHDAKIGELRKLVTSVPEVEAEFARLNRDYDLNKAQYLALVDRLERAKLGQDAEALGSGVRFEVLDPPTAGFRPVTPKRPILIAIVFLAGLALGAALAFLLHKLHPVFNHSHEVESKTGLPVLGVVSYTLLESYQAAMRSSYKKLAVAVVGLLLAFVVVLVISRGGANPLA